MKNPYDKYQRHPDGEGANKHRLEQVAPKLLKDCHAMWELLDDIRTTREFPDMASHIIDDMKKLLAQIEQDHGPRR